jgi:hypothetical protein
MTGDIDTPNRRTMLAGLVATPVVALPAVAEALAGPGDELERLIEAHKAAHRTWLAALKRADVVVRLEVPTGLGDPLDDDELTRGVCKSVLKSLYHIERQRIVTMECWDADLARQAHEKLDALELEYTANVDKVFDENDRAHEEENAAAAAEKAALLALAACPVRSLDEARRKAEYLLGDDLDDCFKVTGVAEGLLRSFVSADV